MTVEAILREVEKRLGELDEKAKEAVKLAVKLAQGETLPEQPEPQWQGENPPFDEMAKLDMMERSKIMWELERLNREWLLRQCEKLQASWLIVVDGKVLRYGGSWANFVNDGERLQIARQTGKLPLVFIHPKMLLVEETHWSQLGTEDAYPTLTIVLVGNGQCLELTGDFDTGATGVFVDADLLSAYQIVKFLPTDQWSMETHLGEPFVFCPKALTVTLRADDGTERTEQNFGIACVLNWRQSPFVAINPNRTALIGRDICLRLQPKITLNFEAKTTSVAF